jgi:two-component system chemotaxis response regulator CheY
MAKTIVLVDDSKTLLASVGAVLTEGGFVTKTFDEPTRALAELASFAADLVITDLNMPNMDGIQLIRELRKLPGYKFTPILLLTTESQADKRAAAKAAGATGWLVKPVKSADLLAVIRKVVPGA